MSISSIIAYGFGSWGSVNELPTLGFGIGEAATAATPDGVDYAAANWKAHYKTSDWKPHFAAANMRPDYTVK